MTTLQQAIETITGLTWRASAPEQPIRGDTWTENGGTRLRVVTARYDQINAPVTDASTVLAAVRTAAGWEAATAREERMSTTGALLATLAVRQAGTTPAAVATALPGDADNSPASTAFVAAAVGAEATARGTAITDAIEAERASEREHQSGTYAPLQNQVHVRSFGAVMDAKQCTDGAITSGSAVLTSASAGFAAEDVGKTLFVTGAGAAGGFLVTTIASVQSATQATLAATASTTVASDAAFRFGTDNLSAFQAAVSAVVAAGGGTVLLDGGSTGFYLSSGTPFSIPVNTTVRIQGAGWCSSSTAAKWTQVMRIPSSTSPLVSAVGTGLATASRVYPSIRNIQFHGGDGAGTVVLIQRSLQADLDTVTIGYASGTLLRGTELFNSTIRNTQFHNGGSGTGTPATLFDASQDADGASGNSIHLIGCEWEANGGTDLKITGNTAGAPTGQDWTVGVWITNAKMERNTGSHPLIDLDRVGGFEMSDFMLHLGPSATGSHIKQAGAAAVPMRANCFANGMISGSVQSGGVESGAASIQYFVDHQAGVMQFANVSFNGTPTTTYLHVGSSVGLNNLRLRNVAVGNRALLITDDRAGSTYTYGSIPLVTAVEGFAPTLSVNRPVWIFVDGSTTKITYVNVPLPADHAVGSAPKVRVTWYSDVNTGAIRWNVGYKILTQSGSDITVGQTDAFSTVTVPGTANTTTSTTFTLAAANPGDLVAVYLQRIGADAADTATGGGRVLGVDLLYPQAL